MTGLCVIPVVEGHGEVEAVPRLLRRIGAELFNYHQIDVLHPIRGQRGRMTKPIHLARWLGIAAGKLHQHQSEAPKCILVLADADDECPCDVAASMREIALAACSHIDVACVVAHRAFESWFVAAADSLDKYLTCDAVPETPEQYGKGWIEERFRGGSYGPRIHQPRMAASMNLAICRSRSRSFDKLCCELEKRLAPIGGATAP